MANFTIHTSKQLAAAADYLACLNKAERHTFKVFAAFANLRKSDKHCFFKYSTLAKKTGFALSTVKKHVKRFFEIGLITKIKSWAYSDKIGQVKQNANQYLFEIDRILELISTKEKLRNHKVTVKIEQKDGLSTRTLLTDTSLTDTKDIRSSHADPVSEVSREEKLLLEAKEQLNKLKQVKIFKNKQEAWAAKGRRYFCNATGGLYIHKSHIDKPWKCIGFVIGSQAHSDVIDYVREIEKFILRMAQ